MNINMKKIIFTLILIISFLGIGNNYIYAAEANIVASSAELGGEITVTVTFPNECFGYEGKIKVTFADGTEKISSQYSSLNYSGLDSSFSRTITYTVKADVVGSGTAQMIDIVMGDEKGNKINSNSVVQTGFKVTEVGKNVTENTVLNTTSNVVLNNVSTADTNTVGETKNETKKETITVTMKEEVNKTMYVAEDVSSCNVRNADSKKAEIIGGLKKGAKVEVTGITSNGWYRIKYYGETAYVADVLTDTKLEEKEDENKNEISNEVSNETSNEVENSVIENNTDELNNLKNTIGVIPEVGNNIFDVLFIIVTVSCIGYALYISYKNRDEV